VKSPLNATVFLWSVSPNEKVSGKTPESVSVAHKRFGARPSTHMSGYRVNQELAR
jgi:hypothetical protein